MIYILFLMGLEIPTLEIGKPVFTLDLDDRGIISPNAVLTSKGNIYCLSAREGTLFIIQDGYHIVAVGRKGKGPGELEMPLGFQVKGNEVRIYDMNKAAVLLYTFHGSNIHQVTFKGRIDLERGIGCVFLDGGGYIVQTGFKDGRFAYFDEHHAVRRPEPPTVVVLPHG